MGIARAKFDGAQSASEVVLKDSTHVLVTYPPRHLRGLVVTAECRVGTPSTTIPDSGAGDAADVSSLSTTVATAAKRGATTLELADATGAVVGRRILIGAQLEIVAKSISANTLTLQRPLVEDVASGAAVKGLEITHALTAAETSTLGHGTVIWEVTDPDEKENWTQPILIAPRSTAFNLDPEMLRAMYPIVDRLALPHDFDFNDVLKTAWDGEVARYFFRHGLDPAYIVDWAVLDDWHAVACVYRLVLNLPNVDPETIDQWRGFLQVARDSALDDRRFWYSDTEEVQAGGGPIVGASRRSFKR